MTATTQLKEALSGLLNKGREQASAQARPVLVSLAQPFPQEITPLEVFRNTAAKKATVTFWGQPDQDFWMVGDGSITMLTAGGETRIDGIKGQAGNLSGSALIDAPPIRGVGPVFMGGFRYDTQSKRDEIWRSFPDALMILPRFLFSWSNSERWLTVNALVEPATNVQALTEILLEDLQSAVRGHTSERHQPLIKRITQSSKEAWHNKVSSALHAIDTGELTKVVLSRRKVLHADGNFSIDNALRRLCTDYPECTIFATCIGNTSFIGATPEGLACVDHKKLSVACLASSAARGSNAEDDRQLQAQLFASQKERAEHNAVTEMVAGVLKDICGELSYDNEPQLMKLKNIQHLHTCFTGTLPTGISILDIVQRLHPTPAVAGTPTERGLALINELEGDRGWYAAPVGWLGRNGEGDFAVAIRSALVDGDRAFLHAGCGIVAGSDPEREYQETELKFQPLLTALGGH
ncbi:MAG: isochorismate synthase [Dehalococcoidales bacterium]|nr:isochorismate synthase [Dehalococcoidales bacterium]